MQNPIQKYRQSSIVLEKPGVLPEILKTLTSYNYPTVQHFLLCTRFLLAYVYKRVRGIFFNFFKSWVICKKLKRTGFYILVFYIFINNTRSEQNKRNPEHAFLDIIT